ncbi:MAG: fimbrillin family protein [Bacteroidales bacterium]|nr:fimbrillin family protein [Bacteroidales bacterium]
MKAKYYILSLGLLLLSGCKSDDLYLPAIEEEDSPIAVGEPILFSALVPDISSSSRATKEEWDKQHEKYKSVYLKYNFGIKMWKINGENDTVPWNEKVYNYEPERYTDIDKKAPDSKGELKPNSKDTLYWEDNVTKWGFSVTANDNELSKDQYFEQAWLNMDKLTGFSYVPEWDDATQSGSKLEKGMVCKTPKEWYNANKALLAAGEMPKPEDLKRIPLYMKHDRAWITIVLKAGEGVTREALDFTRAQQNIKMDIHSYDGSNTLKINSWAREAYVKYDADVNGPAQTDASTTSFNAIVNPFNYGGDNKDKKQLARINVSGMNFSFYASNDTRYVNGTIEEKAEADKAYNLTPGKHLTIEATLSLASRKILITSWIEDWTEVATNIVCDDYGQNGDPVVIKNRKDLIAFLENEKVNKAGGVGIIQPTKLNLDTDTTQWEAKYDLNATLNLAGCELYTRHQLFKEMSSSANLVNGTNCGRFVG